VSREQPQSKWVGRNGKVLNSRVSRPASTVPALVGFLKTNEVSIIELLDRLEDLRHSKDARQALLVQASIYLWMLYTTWVSP